MFLFSGEMIQLDLNDSYSGLWVADLSVNQLLQEVDDQIRGTINGVQSSMNMIFDTAKFLLVIACPWPQTFGILVCISFSAVFSGYTESISFNHTLDTYNVDYSKFCRWGFFASYSFMKRGHLLPFHKVVNNIPPEEIHQIKMVVKNPKKDEDEVVRQNIPSTPDM
jgi:iron-regulated transporter 1